MPGLHRHLAMPCVPGFGLVDSMGSRSTWPMPIGHTHCSCPHGPLAVWANGDMPMSNAHAQCSYPLPMPAWANGRVGKWRHLPGQQLLPTTQNESTAATLMVAAQVTVADIGKGFPGTAPPQISSVNLSTQCPCPVYPWERQLHVRERKERLYAVRRRYLGFGEV